MMILAFLLSDAVFHPLLLLALMGLTWAVVQTFYLSLSVALAVNRQVSQPVAV
jgi:hypothetical protein